MNNVILSPSIMCGDLVNLEQSIRELEDNGLTSLHIDVIDANFSPSMPLGLETIRRMREVTDMDFDVHIMANDNEYFINEMIDIGVQSITFHYETSLHIDRYINLIKEAGIKSSIALNPATSLSVLDYSLHQVDMVCLMLINPGFATNKKENQVAYANQKINDLKNKISDNKLNTKIQVDGRVSLDTIAALVEAGANNLVLGSTSLFAKGNSISGNKDIIIEEIKKGKETI